MNLAICGHLSSHPAEPELGWVDQAEKCNLWLDCHPWLLRKLPRATTNVQNNKSYVGVLKCYVGLYKSYVGDKKSYVGVKKSYVGDKKSYVGDKKSYVGV